MADQAKEEFFHPETGEKMSKNAWKKMQKGGDKPKKEKALPTPPAANKTKKEKKVKEPEEICVDNTPKGEKKVLDQFPANYQPRYVESAWQAWYVGM